MLPKIFAKKMNGSTLCVCFGSTVGWSAFLPDEFMKGSFQCGDSVPQEFKQALKESDGTGVARVFYQTVNSKNSIGIKQASDFLQWCKSKSIQMTPISAKLYHPFFLIGEPYSAKEVADKLMEESTRRGWNCPDAQAANALALTWYVRESNLWI